MKDGRTHFAYKAEQAVDLESGTILGVTVQGGSKGDTESFGETWRRPSSRWNRLRGRCRDPGDRCRQGLPQQRCSRLHRRVGPSQLHRGAGPWSSSLEGQEGPAGHRVREPSADPGQSGERMQRQRGERLERPFAHQYETGGMRRLHLRGRSNVLKRVYIHACGCNLGLLMRERVSRHAAEPPGPRFGSPQRPRRSTWSLDARFSPAATRRAIPGGSS